MAVEIKVPSAGESVTEATIGRWLKPNGSAVKAMEPVCELETDKASQEIVAPAAGYLVIATSEGSKVSIGAVIGRIEEQSTASGNGGPVKQSEAPVKAVKQEAASPARGQPEAPPPPRRDTATDRVLSPAARHVAANEHVDPAQLTGTGRGGRIIKEDVLAHVEQRGATHPDAGPPTLPSPVAPAEPVRPSLPEASTALEHRPASTERETRQRMSPIRQRIAERLVAVQQSAAILTTFNEADMSAVMALRARYKESFQKKYGIGLGFMGFFVKACVEALRSFPAVNARIDGPDIVYHNYFDIGVAVSTDKGLMVPVLRQADGLSFAQVEQGIADLAKKARDNRITVADLQGGTFTITNGGIFGSMLSTPILNPPQSGILGMHAIQKRPVVINDEVVVRPMMYLALSYDHRIIDGREAVSFLVRVKECIESPERLMLEV